MSHDIPVPLESIAVALTYESADHQVFLAPWFAEAMRPDDVAAYLSGAIEALEGIRDGFELIAGVTEPTTLH